MSEWKASQAKRDCNQVDNNALSLLARRCKHSAAWLGQDLRVFGTSSTPIVILLWLANKALSLLAKIK